jgi:putative alpha-1,2-mannosidase
VPHDIPGLIELLGGPERTVAILDEMLSLPPKFGVGVYGQEIHEMSEMAAINFGQYSHNNQPVHHVLYIYAAAGRPDRTRYWVRRVLSELYSSEKFSGDEDTGSMAAWFILSSMGLYQLCPGKPEYTLGVPLFDRVVLHLPGEKSTVIEARNQSPKGFYVSNVLVDGKPFDSTTLRHGDLMRGIRLAFQMRVER